jgi:hypothetical protein
VKGLANTYVSKKVLDDLRFAGHGGCLNRILEQLVLLGQSNRLLPSLVLAVDVGCNLSEEYEIVLLQTLSKGNWIVVVVIVDRVT